MGRNYKINFIAVALFAVITSASIAVELPRAELDESADPLTRLRSLMDGATLGIDPLFAYIITSDDPHQSESIASPFRRRHFITGFTGSAGTAVVTQDQAMLWTDGRYYQAAANQLDGNWTLMKDGLPETPTVVQWLQRNCHEGDRIGVDPTLYSHRSWNQLVSAFENVGCIVTAVSENLVDLVWDARPELPNNPITGLVAGFAGKSIERKLTEVRSKMSEANAKVLVVTTLEEIACKCYRSIPLSRV